MPRFSKEAIARRKRAFQQKNRADIARARGCPPANVYEGHDWKLNGEWWECTRCPARVGIQKVQ